jgi:hypothetical protein
VPLNSSMTRGRALMIYPAHSTFFAVVTSSPGGVSPL